MLFFPIQVFFDDDQGLSFVRVKHARNLLKHSIVSFEYNITKINIFIFFIITDIVFCYQIRFSNMTRVNFINKVTNLPRAVLYYHFFFT